MKSTKKGFKALFVSILVLAALVPATAFAAQGNQGDNDFNGDRAPVIIGQDTVGNSQTFMVYTATPSSTNLQNSTRVTITIKGSNSPSGAGGEVVASATVTLKQNGTQTVVIGDFTVTVIVNQNNKIIGCNVVGRPIEQVQ